MIDRLVLLVGRCTTACDSSCSPVVPSLCLLVRGSTATQQSLVWDTRARPPPLARALRKCGGRGVLQPMAADAAHDPEFLAELRAEGVHENLVNWMKEHCGTAARFANFVDEKSEVQAEIVDKVPATAGCRRTRATIVALWRKHGAAESRKLARQAAGIQEVDLEDPLDPPVRDRLLLNFKEYYHFGLRTHSIICDPLLARFKREVDKGTLTVCPIARAQSQARWSSSSSRASRVQISATVAMDVGTAQMSTVAVKTMNEYLRGLKLIMTGLAIVGNYEVRTTAGDLRESRWAPWDECCDYVSRVEQRCFPDGQASPTVQQVRTADESTRELWAEWVRLEGLTLGEAIRRSKVEAAPFWLWAGQESAPEAREREASGSNKRARSVEMNNSPGGVVRFTSKGKPICAAWNENSCSKSCPKKELHVCNHRLLNGRPCMATAHRRCEAH